MTRTPVTLESYLKDCSRKPDVEYINGELRERPVTSRNHGRLQALLSAWFGMHEEWDVEVAVGVRTRVSPMRVRLPDVVVDRAGDWPDVLVEPPLLLIEIVSDDDTFSGMLKLARDYQTMGMQNIWLLDPEDRSARVWKNGSWMEKSRLEVAGTEIYLDPKNLYARLFRDAQ